MSGYIVNMANINVTALRQTAIDGIKNAILGLRDVMALQGMVPGWDMTISGGPTEPTRVMYKSLETGTEWVAITAITYNASLCVTSCTYQYSNNSTNGTDGTWSDLDDAAGFNRQTLTYDGNNNLSSTTWS